MSAIEVAGFGSVQHMPRVLLPGYGWASLRLGCLSQDLYHAQCALPATVLSPVYLGVIWLLGFFFLLCVYQLLVLCHRRSVSASASEAKLKCSNTTHGSKVTSSKACDAGPTLVLQQRMDDQLALLLV